MNSQKKILQFKLNGQVIEQLRKQQTTVVECLKNRLDIVLNDSRIKLNFTKDSKNSIPTAVYFNNNGGNLHFLGEAIPASTSIVKKIEDQKPVLENKKPHIDIPHSDITPSPPRPSIKSKLPPKTASPISNQKKPKATSNIPSTPSQSRVATTPQKTPKPSKASSSEEKYPIKTRIIQRLALQPWSVTEIVKAIDRTQQEKCDQLEVKHILETVAIPIKKGERHKYCLKPTMYKDIKIWDWPYYTPTEKITVADNAKEAYDLLYDNGLDIDRTNLYHPDSPYKPPPSPAPKRSPLSNRKTTPQLHRRPTPTTAGTPSTPLRNSPQTKLKRPLSPVTTAKPKSSPTRAPSSPVQKPVKPHTKPSSSPVIKKSSLEYVKPLSSVKKASPDKKPLQPLLDIKKSPLQSTSPKKPSPVVTVESIHKKSPAAADTKPVETIHKKPPVPVEETIHNKKSPAPLKKSPADTFLLPPKRTTQKTVSTKKPPTELQPSSSIKKPVPPVQKPKSSLPPAKKPAATKSLPNGTTKTTAKRKFQEDDDATSYKSVKELVPVTKKKQAPVIPPPKAPQEPIDIKSQRAFDAYCSNFVRAQASYSRIKRFFKTNYPEYVRAMESTEPPKGTKRSYYDLNVEYQQMIKSNFLKHNKGKENTLMEAEHLLEDCNNKRRRLNFMWNSIKQNKEDHNYKITTA